MGKLPLCAFQGLPDAPACLYRFAGGVLESLPAPFNSSAVSLGRCGGVHGDSLQRATTRAASPDWDTLATPYCSDRSSFDVDRPVALQDHGGGFSSPADPLPNIREFRTTIHNANKCRTEG